MEKNLPIASLLSHLSVYADEASYRKLFDLFFPSLYRFALCFVCSQELAEAAASDSLWALWQRRGQLEKIQDVRVWLYVITRNKCLHLVRERQYRGGALHDFVRVDISFAVSDPDQICISTEMRRKMTRAVNMLSQRCKIIFKLVKEEGLGYQEVADLLNLSSRTVDAQFVAALRAIIQSIKLDYAEPTPNF